MGLKSLTTPSIIKLNSLLFICNNISYVIKFVKCGLLLLRGAIHKTLSGLIKPLKQSYYRLRLISILGCHLLTSCKFLNTCRFYTPPIKTLKIKCVYGGGGGIRTLVQYAYHICRQRPIHIWSSGLTAEAPLLIGLFLNFKSKPLNIIHDSVIVNVVVTDRDCVISSVTYSLIT